MKLYSISINLPVHYRYDFFKQMAKVYRYVYNDIHFEVFSGTDIMGVHNYFFSFALHLFLVRFPFVHNMILLCSHSCLNL